MTSRRTLCTAAAAAALAFSIVPGLAQDREGAVAPTEPAAEVRLTFLGAHMREMAGHRVRIPDGVVDEIISPRVFLLDEPSPENQIGYDDEVAVVVAFGSITVTEGAPVIVTGIPYVWEGTQPSPDFPVLSAEERESLDGRAVVLASAVETAAGVELTGR